MKATATTVPGLNRQIRVEFLPIQTVGLPFWKRLKAAAFEPRRFVLIEAFYFPLPEGRTGMLPAGFDSDGTTVPRAFRMLVDPFGISLAAGVVHDFLYRFRTLLDDEGKPLAVELSRYDADMLMRRINMQVNGIRVLADSLYAALHVFGWIAWAKHRKRDGTPHNDLSMYIDVP